MEQGLRDDKTPFFTALEADITQQEISADNVETAYLNYLEKLQQVARLEIIGTFWQDKDPDTGEEVNTLHVFGRTFHSPHTYFYRTLRQFHDLDALGGDAGHYRRRPCHAADMEPTALCILADVSPRKTVPPKHPGSIDATSKLFRSRTPGLIGR